MKGDPPICSFRYPKQFNEQTTQGDDAYPLYRRRNNGITVEVQGKTLDNRWVIPYNPRLLMMFNCHMNVEVCSSIKSVKYLFKYVYKGHDKQVIQIDQDEKEVVINEIKRFQDARYISPPEAMWRIFSFSLSQIYPAVLALQLHLPNNQMIFQNTSRGMEANVVGIVVYLKHKEAVLFPLIQLKKKALEMGLIENDESLSQCLAEASLFQFPNALRRLFATIMIFCESGDVRKLWNDYFDLLSEDHRLHCQSVERVRNMVLTEIRVFLQSMGKNLHDFDLPNITEDVNLRNVGHRELQEDYGIVVEAEHLYAKDSFNSDQKVVFDEIMTHVDNDLPGMFFIDGPGGTGKIFVYKALLAEVRSRGLIALATASSGATTNNMLGGRTTHSRFKIPINLNNNSMCNIKKQSGATEAIEAVDRTLQDIIGVSLPFGGKIMVMGGNFIRIPDDMTIPCTLRENSIKELINAIFPSIQNNLYSSDYIISRAILSTRNESVDEINDQMIDIFQGEEKIYHSFDEAEDNHNNFYPIEFLNSLTVSGLSPHKLRLKIGCPIILLRNIDPSHGLCNGTRLICKGFQHNVIDAEIAVGQHIGKRVFLPRIPLTLSEDDMFPFKLKGKQFPIRLSFSMTINKAQGQTIPHVGVYLPDSVFSHGQLYVALSRGISQENTKVLGHPAKDFRRDGVYTSNVVYREWKLKIKVSKLDTVDVAVKDKKIEEIDHPVAGAVNQDDLGIDWDEEWWSKNAHEIIEMCKTYD
ncbi:hypothetical protein L1987_65028 [Smallanthus sonchifolius]|uniref:Uncharacterized protein n=1 Tax=Smallanthus sonchifolius TaxID=185202 RepID=A0ACB9BTD0_9ASTR|nr:hypothetical protein L1987_65028 [Smallanthus sonchifolius]